MACTVVIVDDHADFRAGAAKLLEAAGYAIVASCADGRSALDAITALRPDLVVLDVQLPDIDGFGVMAHVDTLAVSPTVVLISTREAADYGDRVARSGAAGFITKADLSTASLAEAVARR
ncbi:MAG: response regulator transcription factor [Actinomycetota bacterium]|nr:response regulator transcription factor [Actinomycetota bacterium]